MTAVRTDAGEHRDGNIGHQRLHQVVVELRGDDVVLARESWGCGDARIVLPAARLKAATAALVGDEAPVAIGRQQGVDEHK
jgi:hypothetical protein